MYLFFKLSLHDMIVPRKKEKNLQKYLKRDFIKAFNLRILLKKFTEKSMILKLLHRANVII